MSPSWPESISPFSISTPGWYSSRCPTISTRPLSRAAATTRSASSTDCASGFSTKQCFPARRTRSARAACVGTGVASATASRSASSSRSSSAVAVLAPGWAAAWRSSRSGEASQSHATSARRPRFRARFGPQYPSPTTPILTGERSQAHQVRRLDAARDAAEVDHERRLAHQPLDVEVRVGGHDHDAVRVLRPLAAEPEVGQLGDVVVEVAHVGALLAEQPDAPERGRLAQVADPRLVGHAHDRDARSLDRLDLVVQRAPDPLDAEVRHALVHLAGQLDELGLHVELARPPGEVEG